MTAHACRLCERPTGSDRALCRTCMTELDTALGKCGWLDAQLEITITRQRSAPIEGGSRSSGHALPWHETASDAQRALGATLTRWVGYVSAYDRPGPSDRVSEKAAWLRAHLPQIVANPELGPDAHDEITDAVAEAERVVFWTKRARVYLGPCERPVLDEDGLILIAKCDGDLYADEGALEGVCRHCGATVSTLEAQIELNARLDATLMTPAEIATAAVYLGIRAPREVVRERVNRWHRHHLIEQRGTNESGHPLFRYGDVRRRLLDDLERQQTGRKAAGA